MPDLYDNAPSRPPEAAAAQADTSGEEDQEAGVLPRSFFMGKDLKPGAICEVKIERVMDNDVQVRYVPHGKDEEESPAEDSSAPSAAPAAPPPQAGPPGMYD